MYFYWLTPFRSKLQRGRVSLGERAHPNPLRLDQHRIVAHRELNDDHRAARVERRSLTLSASASPLPLGVVFLACKGLENREDLKVHLFPRTGLRVAARHSNLLETLLDHDRHSCGPPPSALIARPFMRIAGAQTADRIERYQAAAFDTTRTGTPLYAGTLLPSA